MTATAQVTVFTKVPAPDDADGALLSKRIALGPDGKPAPDGSPCRMLKGTTCAAPAADAAALAWVIDGLRPCDALALGSIVGGNGAVMNVVTAAALSKMPAARRGNNTIARTREFLAFRQNAAAWLLIDFDRKGMPPEIAARIEAADGLWPALLAVAPGLHKAARVVRASTSAGLSRADTGERFASSGGVHVYVLVEDGADIDRALRALHARCWMHGLGWHLVGAAGQLLERSIVDATVRFPERLVFEGKPDLVPPLVQDAAARAPAAIVDLKKVGLHYYAAHPTTDVSVACYAFGPAGEVRTWYPGAPVPAEVQRHIAAGGRMVAHNTAFEQAILQCILGPRHGWPIPKPGQWSCTLARAAYHGFPPSLEELSEALPLDNRKDQEGHALMLRMARPRGFRPDGTARWWHREEPARLTALVEYCRKDVLAEQELNWRLPELPEQERRLWMLDAEINDRGILIDIVGTQSLAAAVEAEVAALDAELAQLTGTAVSAVTNPRALKAWLGERGLPFACLDKEHLAGALQDPVVIADPAAYRALQLRQEGAKASTAKLKPMLGTLGADDRARGLFHYYGAPRTGRWAGRRIQPQNLVRGHADATAIIDAMVAGAKLEDLAQQYQSGRLELVAGCLRGLFVAPPGKRLVVADLAQIEARVLAWLAGQEDLLDVFRDPERDVYVFTADRLGSDLRQLGKVATLGLGFQMGAERFVDAAKGYGVVLSEDGAAQHVAQWRSDHPAIVRLWWDMADTVAAIAGGPVGDEAEVGRCLVYRRSGSVRIRLPSRRELIYHQMQLVERPGSSRGELRFMGPHPLSRKWTQQRTYGGKLVENITQATARDVLSETMLELHARGHTLLGSVHDEILLEAEAATAETLLEETLALMRTPPAWAEGLPVEAEGFVSPRYRKS